MASDNQDFGIASPSVPAGAGVGSLLRETRQRLGQDIVFVATSLRIRQPYLQAIEDCRYQDLPGSTYAVGFVRGYAEYLGLDGKEIVRRFKQETGADFGGRTELVFPSAVSESSIPTGALLFFALVAAFAAYGAWYWYRANESSVAETVPALPDRLAALIHRPVGTGAEVVPVTAADGIKPVDAVAAPPAIQPQQAVPGSVHDDVVPPNEGDGAQSPAAPMAAAPVPAPVAADPVPPAPAVAPVVVPSELIKPSDAMPAKDAKMAEAKAAADAAKAAKAAADDAIEAAKVEEVDKAIDAEKPAEPPKPVEMPKPEPVVSAATGASRVVLRAEEDCWIEIRDATGVMVHSRLLRKGDTYSVPGRSGLTLTAGNAGALTLLLDGKATAPLGRAGMVRHDVPLDPERLGGGSGE